MTQKLHPDYLLENGYGLVTNTMPVRIKKMVLKDRVEHFKCLLLSHNINKTLDGKLALRRLKDLAKAKQQLEGLK